MATGLTKTALTRQLAEKLELTNKQVAPSWICWLRPRLRKRRRTASSSSPAIGRLVKAERKARIGRNPQTGAAIKIKAKTVVKFRVAKAAKTSSLPLRSSSIRTVFPTKDKRGRAQLPSFHWR